MMNRIGWRQGDSTKVYVECEGQDRLVGSGRSICGTTRPRHQIRRHHWRDRSRETGGGCQHVDVAENLAIERATRLFNCGFANVQPNSGSQANQAVFLALAKRRDDLVLNAQGHKSARRSLPNYNMDFVSHGMVAMTSSSS